MSALSTYIMTSSHLISIPSMYFFCFSLGPCYSSWVFLVESSSAACGSVSASATLPTVCWPSAVLAACARYELLMRSIQQGHCTLRHITADADLSTRRRHLTPRSVFTRQFIHNASYTEISVFKYLSRRFYIGELTEFSFHH